MNEVLPTAMLPSPQHLTGPARKKTHWGLRQRRPSDRALVRRAARSCSARHAPCYASAAVWLRSPPGSTLDPPFLQHMLAAALTAVCSCLQCRRSSSMRQGSRCHCRCPCRYLCPCRCLYHSQPAGMSQSSSSWTSWARWSLLEGQRVSVGEREAVRARRFTELPPVRCAAQQQQLHLSSC